MWYADPSGATERAELTCAGLRVYPGDNELGLGIAAVSARLADGGLRVVAGCCPNLLREAQLYRYDDEVGGGGAEAPVDAHNHALAALRDLVCCLDRRRMARRRPVTAPAAHAGPPVEPNAGQQAAKERR